jgi:hypothetical protein
MVHPVSKTLPDIEYHIHFCYVAMVGNRQQDLAPWRQPEERKKDI